MTTGPDPTGERARSVARTAWRHLLNRHDLAQALDQLTAETGHPDPLDLAVERLTRPPGDPHHP